MKTFSVALSALLILSAFAAEAPLPGANGLSEDEVFAGLAQIDQNPLGNGLLSLVQAHLSTESKDSVDEILAILNEILENLRRQQNEDDELFQITEANCDRSIKQSNIDIDDYIQSIKDSNEKLEQSQGELAYEQEELPKKQAQLDEALAQLASGQAIRDSAYLAWKEREDRYALAIESMEKAIREFNRINLGPALPVKIDITEVDFVQIHSMIHSSRIQDAQFDHLYEPVLAQVSQFRLEDGPQVPRTLEQLEALKQALEDARYRETSAEEEVAGAWRIQSGLLATQKMNLIIEIENSNKRIDNAQTSINQYQGELTQFSQLLESTRIFLQNKITECKAKSEEYSVSKEKRKIDTELIERLIAYVENNAVRVRKYSRV